MLLFLRLRVWLFGHCFLKFQGLVRVCIIYLPSERTWIFFYLFREFRNLFTADMSNRSCELQGKVRL
jgi:hypothetical protein